MPRPLPTVWGGPAPPEIIERGTAVLPAIPLPTTFSLLEGLASLGFDI